MSTCDDCDHIQPPLGFYNIIAACVQSFCDRAHCGHIFLLTIAISIKEDSICYLLDEFSKEKR